MGRETVQYNLMEIYMKVYEIPGIRIRVETHHLSLPIYIYHGVNILDICDIIDKIGYIFSMSIRTKFWDIKS